MGLILELLDRQRQRESAEEMSKFVTEVQASGNRSRALEVVKNRSTRFQSPKEFADAFRIVDEFYPEASKEIKTITHFDEVTGQPTTGFVPSGEIERLSDPAEVKRRFGPGATLTKPDLETFYSPPDEKGRVEVLGRFPISQRPRGAITLPELTEARRVRTETARDRREATQGEQFEARMDLSERRLDATLSQLGSPATDRDRQFARGTLEKASRMTAMSMNANILPDGSFAFDETDKAKLFNDRTSFMLELSRQEPDILLKPNGFVELHSRANKALPVPEPKPLEPPPRREPGLAQRLRNKLTGKEEESAKPAVKPAAKAAEGDPASQIKAKAAEINSRKDITAEQKAVALKRLREIAAKNKVKVGF